VSSECQSVEIVRVSECRLSGCQVSGVRVSVAPGVRVSECRKLSSVECLRVSGDGNAGVWCHVSSVCQVMVANKGVRCRIV
jgi:hypothetical protein